LKKLLADLLDRALRHPKTTAVALVGVIGFVFTHFGKTLDTASTNELAGAVAAIIAVMANLFMRDAERKPKANEVSKDWQPPEEQQ
jgi:hypothetical protein